MSGEGKLCYKPNDGRLAFKRGGDGSLVFKVAAGDWTQISFAWGSDGRDLDICAYWDGAPSMQMGYGHDTSTSEKISGAYHIFYSGDIRGTDASEWCKIKMKPWQNGGARTFKVHFNYFGHDSEHGASTCTVIASQMGGETFVKREQACSTSEDGTNPRAANTGDPYCVVSFDETGKLIGVS